jgi:hypothetical protein
VPAPTNERQRLELELGELPAQIAALRRELENGRPHRARGGRLLWAAENLERRLLALRVRLATLPTEPRSTVPTRAQQAKACVSRIGRSP